MMFFLEQALHFEAYEKSGVIWGYDFRVIFEIEKTDFVFHTFLKNNFVFVVFFYKRWLILEREPEVKFQQLLQ